MNINREKASRVDPISDICLLADMLLELLRCVGKPTLALRVNTLRGNQGKVLEVVFSPDGTRIATTGSDRSIKIWDVHSGQSVATMTGHDNDVIGVVFSSNGEQLVSVSNDAFFKRWDARSGQEISTFQFQHQGKVQDVAFSPDGNRIVTCGDTEGIVLWDATTGQEIARRANELRWPQSIAFSPDGRSIAAGGYDLVALWDGELKQNLWLGNERAGWILDVTFSPDGMRIASIGQRDANVLVWDVDTGKNNMAFRGHGGGLFGVAFSPDGGRLASVSADKMLMMWDARTGQKAISIQAHDRKVYALAYSNDGKRLASVSIDGTFKLWDVATCLEIASTKGPPVHDPRKGVHCVAFSPNDAYIAFGTGDYDVKVVDGRTGEELQALRGHESSIGGLVFHPDNKRLFTASDDQTVRIWDVDSGKEIAMLEGHTGPVYGVAVNPDGSRLATSSEDRTIRVWDARSGRELQTLSGHLSGVWDVEFSPEGKQIVSGGDDGTIRMWDLQSGKEIMQLHGHSAGVIGSVFSPDGKRIASTSYDPTLRLWDAQTGREWIAIEASAFGEKNEAGSQVHSFVGVAFSPDGMRIAAGMDNGIIKFLDAPMQHEVTALSGHTDTLIQWSFSADGRWIYSASKNEKLCWDVASKRLDPNAEWNPPSKPTHVSVDGRWLIDRDGKDLMLVDRNYKNSPDEKRYRALKARIDPKWHYERATAATTSANWYAATHHFAWLMKHQPDQASYSAGLQSSFQNLKSLFEQQRQDLEPHLATVVKETLKLPPVDEPPNSSFEVPQIGKRTFAFRRTVPGWKTTSRMFEIWSSGFQDVPAHDGDQFVEVNANDEGTLYQDQHGIEKGAVYEFSFAHRGRNGNDTMNLTITDMGADNSIGGGDDTELFSKEFTTGKNAWAVYDSTNEPTITALGHKVRFAFSAVFATGGKGPDKTEGNFLDAVHFGVGVVSAKHKADSVN